VSRNVPAHRRARGGGRRLAVIAAVLTVAVAVITLGVVGCGSSSPSSAPPSGSAAKPGTTTTTAPTTTTTRPPDAPPPIGATAFSDPTTPWVGAGRDVGPTPAVYTIQLHAAGEPVAAAWIDTKRATARVYAGTDQPSGSWTYQGAIGAQDEPSLLAACNGGFKFQDTPAGFYADGKQGEPLQNGLGSFVVLQNGTATVADWGRDATLTPDVAFVRQNLPLLVDGGQPAANAGNPAAWGDPLHGNYENYRSAIGVDAAGHLLYAAGPALMPLTLAQVMVALGAVRAMELDINPEWVTFVTFTGAPPAVTGTSLLSSMYFPTTHFLSVSERDFFAFFAKPQP
jgi:hypothetical protein